MSPVEYFQPSKKIGNHCGYCDNCNNCDNASCAVNASCINHVKLGHFMYTLCVSINLVGLHYYLSIYNQLS